jgi:transposase-like protein
MAFNAPVAATLKWRKQVSMTPTHMPEIWVLQLREPLWWPYGHRFFRQQEDLENMVGLLVPDGAQSFQPTDFQGIGHDGKDGTGNDHRPEGGHRKKKADIRLSGVVETDEVYIVCGHKGQPDKVTEAGRPPHRRRLKGARGRGTLDTEKPPIIGFIQRGGFLVLRMLRNVQQQTIKPVFEQHVEPGTLVYTDEYNIYARLEEWGFGHKSVCHSNGEYARDEDGDGFCEVHVNTQEGIWSVLRSWIRPHRGISQEKLPVYLGFFEFLFNARKRGKAILGDLMVTILAPDLRKIEDVFPSPWFYLRANI